MKNLIWLLIALITFLAFGMQKFSLATELMISGDRVVITGTVTEVDPDEFTLQAAGGLYDIDVSRMNLNTDIDEILQPGMRVAVQGDFGNSIGVNDPTIEAREIALVSPNLTGEAATRLLLQDDLVDQYRGRLNNNEGNFFNQGDTAD